MKLDYSMTTPNEPGIERYFYLMNYLIEAGLGKAVCAPICVVDLDSIKYMSDKKEGLQLVYPILAAGGYMTGIPQDPLLHKPYLEALEKVVRSLHEAGVVHWDLVPSNIMWKEEQSGDERKKVDVILVDCDTMQFTTEPIRHYNESQICGARSRWANKVAEMYKFDFIPNALNEVENEEDQAHSKKWSKYNMVFYDLNYLELIRANIRANIACPDLCMSVSREEWNKLEPSERAVACARSATDISRAFKRLLESAAAN